MKRSLFAVVRVVALVGVSTAVPAFAQTTQEPPIELTVGYQLAHVPDETFPFGLNLDISRAFDEAWSVVGEFGWAYDEQDDGPGDGTLQAIHAGAGPRWSSRSRERVTPFAQVLAGVVNTRANLDFGGSELNDADTAFMLQPGGGVSVPFGDRWDAVAQFDLRYAFYTEELDEQFRIFLGGRVRLR